jgi:DNA-binding XRE family transcriptional regulator
MGRLAELFDVKRSREQLGVTQQELADLLGVSVRTVQSCEQGWRKPSAALEKSLLLLHLASRQGADLSSQVCWEQVPCPQEDQQRCLAHRARQGHLCWLLSGTSCRGQKIGTWEAKKRVCGECEFLIGMLG